MNAKPEISSASLTITSRLLKNIYNYFLSVNTKQCFILAWPEWKPRTLSIFVS